MKKMNQEVKKMWVEALRSGEYQQGKHHLNDNGKFCCLGVLCDLAVKDGVNLKVNPEPQNSYVITYDEHRCWLPHKVAGWAQFPYDKSGGLVEMNDKLNCSLEEIALYIEKNL